jgi:hypothetical protein
VTAMTTGKVALVLESDEVEDEATMPTDVTVPKTFVVASVGVTCTCWPRLIDARSLLPTVALTTQEDVEITVTSALEVLAPVVVDPVDPVDPVEPVEPVEPLPTVSPLLTSTSATVPVTVERSVPSDSDFLAALRLLFACATWAFADASDRLVVLDEDSADVSASSAEDRLAFATVTAATRSVVPTVASACPFVTLSPTATFTFVTVPLTANDRSASCADAIVPVVETVWLTVVDDTVDSVVVELPDPEEDLVVAQATPPPTQTSTANAAATMTVRRRPRGTRGVDAIVSLFIVRRPRHGRDERIVGGRPGDEVARG